jgi:O-antigen/teichoic acid export membrane protein
MSVRRSMGWSFSAQFLNFIVAFSCSILIARLITPREFGIYAMGGAITGLVSIVFNTGLAAYIVREPEVDTLKLRSVFTVNFLITVLMSVSFFTAGLTATHLFDSPDVGDFMLVYSFVPLISSFEFVLFALCQREMKFNIIALMSILRTVTLYGATIIFALDGFRHMSFAWASIVSTTVATVAFQFVHWAPAVWLPRFAGFKQILRFGMQMISISGFHQLGTRAGDMVLGSWLGLATLGLYARASGLSHQIYGNIYGASASVLFTKLAADLRDKGTFHEAYLRALRLILAVIWPMMGGLAILSYPVIYHLYGAQWVAAALPLTLLLIAHIISLGIAMAWEVFVLRGETSRQVKIESIRSISGLVLFSIGCLFSLSAAAAAKIAESVLAYLLYRPHMDRLVGSTRGELDRIYSEALLLTGAAVVPSFLLMLWFRWSPTTPLPLIVAAVSVGIALWVYLIFARQHALVEELRRAADKFLGTRGKGRRL